MVRHARDGSRPVSLSCKAALFIPVMMAALLAAPAARTQSAVNPDPGNAMVMPKFTGGFFGRFTTTPSAEAAPQTVQRPQRVRIAKTRKRTAPVVIARTTRAEPVAVQTAEPAGMSWPHAAGNVGLATIAPLTVKTVREMVEPGPEPALAFENELSEVDLAARPVMVAGASAEPLVPQSTDGRAIAESDAAAEQPRVYAMADAVKAITQSAWLEPMLLVLAGALAALSAMRLFA